MTILLLLLTYSHLCAQSGNVYRRYFPKIFNSTTSSTGLAVVNLSSSTAALTFKAYSNAGALLDSSTVSLQSKKQLAQLVSELLPRAGENAGWLVLESSVPDVEGFFLLFDNSVTVMDGAAAAGSVLRDFLIPAGDDGELSLVNPTDASVTCSLEYIDPAGGGRPATQITVPAMGRTTVRVAAIRPAGAAAGYLRGRSNGLLPLLIIDKAGWLGALAPIESATQTTVSQGHYEASKTLYAPQFASGGGFATVMDIVNLENTVTVLRLKLIGDTGEQQGSTGELILPPIGSARISGTTLFGILNTGNLVQGYVQIQSTDGRFAGWVRFSDPGETSFGSALQFVDTGLRATYFSQVAQNDMFFTGLAALNPNPGSVTAQITVYDTEGGVIAQSSRQIPSGGRFSKLLSELVGALPPLSKGYFSMITDLPVASFALFGTLSGDALSAIPPQLSAPAFSCGSSVSDIDGNHYGIVAIGTQCWMKENLRVTKYHDGTIIPLDESGGAEGNAAGETWSARTTGARTVFSHTNTNLTTYGYLYNWHAAIDARGLCPNGWHLPTDAEWTTLTTSLGTNASGKLKSTGTSLWNPPNSGATNESGFTALPGGIRSDRGKFDGLRITANFWTATHTSGRGALGRVLVLNQPDVGSDYHGERSGLSVRCLRD